MSRVLMHGHMYRVLTHAGKVWEKVRYDAPRRVFVSRCDWRHGPRDIPEADVVRISPRRGDKERSGGVPFTDLAQWEVAA